MSMIGCGQYQDNNAIKFDLHLRQFTNCMYKHSNSIDFLNFVIENLGVGACTAVATTLQYNCDIIG